MLLEFRPSPNEPGGRGRTLEHTLGRVMPSIPISMEQRLCRWLLMMHDRAETEELSYTHEFLAHMLGADRKSVTLAAQAMQAAGLIGYRRGDIQIVDRPGLEKTACECYAMVHERFDEFLTPPSTAVQGNTKGRIKADRLLDHEINRTSFKAMRAKAASPQLPQLLNENIRAAARRAAATLTFPCADRTAACASTRRAPH